MHEKGHKAARDYIENNIENLTLIQAEKDGNVSAEYIQDEAKKGEEYIDEMGGTFYNTINSIYSMGIQTQDRHIEIQKHLNKIYSN